MQDEQTDPTEQTYEEIILAAATIESSLVINKLLHDLADLMENLATARVREGVKRNITEWGAKYDRAEAGERERNLHRMVNRLRSESHEAERRYAEAQENGEVKP